MAKGKRGVMECCDFGFRISECGLGRRGGFEHLIVEIYLEFVIVFLRASWFKFLI
jgi:hypothetical protein